MADTRSELRSDREVNESEAPDMTKVTIKMPTWMHDELRQRARRRGISVTELMRRAVALDRLIYDDNDENEIVVRNTRTKQESLVRLY